MSEKVFFLWSYSDIAHLHTRVPSFHYTMGVYLGGINSTAAGNLVKLHKGKRITSPKKTKKYVGGGSPI